MGNSRKFRNINTDLGALCKDFLLCPLVYSGTHLWPATLAFIPPTLTLCLSDSSMSSVTGLGALPKPVSAACFLASSPCHPGLRTCGLTHGERPASPFLIKLGPTGCLFIARGKAHLKSNPHEGGWAKGYSMIPSPWSLSEALFPATTPTPQAREQELFRLFSL